jgi:hypothetical protein
MQRLLAVGGAPKGWVRFSRYGGNGRRSGTSGMDNRVAGVGFMRTYLMLPGGGICRVVDGLGGPNLGSVGPIA